MMTTGQDSAFEDRTETTPIEITHQTTGSSMTSSSSRGANFYFQCAVLVVGVVGAAANGLVLYGLVASKQHKKHVLIFNQNALDFVNCLFVVVSYSLRLSNINLDGTFGHWLCILFLADGCTWVPYIGSMINLAAISIERYLKVVHHVWAKEKLRKWMIYSTIAFAWISGIVIAAAAIVPTTAVVNGVCYARWFFASPAARMAFAIWNSLSFYVIILLIFIFCYGRILVTIRRQARVMATHSGPSASNTAQNQSNKIQTNVIKTVILVSGLYAVTWAPMYIYSLLKNLYSQHKIGLNGFFAILSIGYLYICVNPFIYATKFDPVRRVLLDLIPYKKNTPPLENVDNT